MTVRRTGRTQRRRTDELPDQGKHRRIQRAASPSVRQFNRRHHHTEQQQAQQIAARERDRLDNSRFASNLVFVRSVEQSQQPQPSQPTPVPREDLNHPTNDQVSTPQSSPESKPVDGGYKRPVEANIDPQFVLLDEQQSTLLLEAVVDEALSNAIHHGNDKVVKLAQGIGGRGTLSALLAELYRRYRGEGLSLSEIKQQAATNHAAAGEFGLVDSLRRFCRQLGPFAVNLVFFNVLFLNGAKRVQPDVQRHVGQIGARGAEDDGDVSRGLGGIDVDARKIALGVTFLTASRAIVAPHVAEFSVLPLVADTARRQVCPANGSGPNRFEPGVPLTHAQ